MVYIQKEKKPREAFEGELRGIHVKEDAPVSVERDGKTFNAFKYLDVSVLDRSQANPKTGEPGLWHNIRISAPKESPIVLEDFTVLKRCDDLVTAKAYPHIRGKYYVSESEKRDPVTKKIVVENGEAVVYKNKKMSLADLKTLEIVVEHAAEDAA